MHSRLFAMTSRAPWRLCVRAAAVLMLGICGAGAHAETMSDKLAAQTSFNIPAQPLSGSLKQLAKQAGIQILFEEQVVQGFEAPALQANESALQALGILLNNTGLEFTAKGETVAVRRKSLAPVTATGDAAFLVSPHPQDGAHDANGAGAIRLAQNASSPAQAQPPAEPDAAQNTAANSGRASQDRDLEQIVVTAQKREESIRDVPASVNVITGAKLEELGATQLADIVGYVPGLNIAQGNAPGRNTLILRGLNLPSPTALVGTYIDDAPVGASTGKVGTASHALDLLPYDFQRIEVLSGPQGTLYGANAMGGLVKYVTRKPNLHHFESRFGAGFKSSAGGGDSGWTARASLNAPLSEGKAALRLSVSDDLTPGFIDHPNQSRDDSNRNRETMARAALLLEPTDGISVDLAALYQRLKSYDASTVTLAQTGAGLVPDTGELAGSQVVPGRYNTRLNYYSATINADLGWASLVSAGSYSRSRDVEQQQGYLPESLITGRGMQRNQLPLDKWTEELRLSSTAGRLEWLFGVFYTDEKSKQIQEGLALDSSNQVVANPQINPLIHIEQPARYKERAVFANGTWKFTPAFDVSLGGRWSKNDQRFQGIPSCSAQGAPLFGACPPVGALNTSSEDVFNYAISPRYRFSEDIMAYVRVASGYRPGGPNTPLPGVPSSIQSDTLVNYEAGIKSEWLDRKLRFNASIYRIDWQDIQITASLLPPNPPFRYGTNGNKAQARGFEAATGYAPVRGLQFGLNLTYTDAFLTEDMPVNSTLKGHSGADLPYVPRWSGSLTADYDRPLVNGWTAAVGGGWRYTGKRYITLNDSANCPGQCAGGSSVPRLSSYGVLDAHAGVSNERWNVNLVVRNLTNKYALVNVTGSSFIPGVVPAFGTALQPRLAILNVDYTF